MTIGYHLFQIDRKIRRHLNLALDKQAGITGQQARILAFVSHGGTSQAVLEKELCLRRSTISGIIDTMERGNLIKRVPSPIDGRAKSLVLTSHGKQVCACCDETMRQFEALLEAALGPKETARLHQILEKLEQALEAPHV